ncbi:hypothetical protein [Gimesia fumaroli]|uniref:Putative assembly protein n=1 Tax=Gimesia fumaroli TaxID=2527976 RepID=A0A518ILL6_9PLAN|nr:hypothetical protein [Gimesia fumaroli]QDV53977.1 putative assembly protein [Gimesia fumaroli]
MSQPDTANQTTNKKTSSKNQKQQRGSAGRIFFVLMLGLCLLLWLAPLIISNTSMKNSILPLVLKRYPGEISTGAVTLSWSQPVVFQNVALKDFEGRDVVRIDQIATKKTLWELATDRKHVGDVNVDGVTSLTYVNEHGLANRDFLTAVLKKGTKEHPEGEPGKEDEKPKTGTQQSLTLHMSDLDLCVVNGKEEETPYLTGMAVTVTRPEQRTEPILVKGIWKEPATEEGEQIDPAKIAFAVSIVNSNDPDASRSGALKFKTEFFDLSQLTPLVSALSPGAHLAGKSNSEMEIKWSGSKESPRFAVKGNWEARPFQFAAPEWIGGDQIQSETAEGNIDVMAANGVLYFKDAHMQSQFGEMTLQGNLNWDDLTDESKREKLAGLLNSRLKLSGNLDLAEAARQLPETVHLKPGMQITGGTVDFQVSNYDPQKPQQAEGQDTVWLIGLKTSDLTGRNGGREIRWQQPVSLLMQIARTSDSFDIQSLRCTSDFLKLTGNGNADHLQIHLEADLNQLSNRLEQFVDLQEIALKGKMDGEISFDVSDQKWETLSFLQFKNLQLALPDRRGWQEPSLKLTVEGAGNSNEKQIHVERFIVTLVAGEDAFQAKLEQPTTVNRKRDETAKQELLPFKIQLKGKLASWADRVRPLSKQDLQLAGDVQFASSVSFGDQYVAHENTTVNLTNVRVFTPTLWIDEPRAEIKTAGSWDELHKTLKASEFTYRGSAIVLNGEKLEVQLPHDDIHTTSLVGSLSYKCDLHQLSRWFQNPAEPPEQKYYGLVTGQANVIVTEETRMASWRTTITDFAIEAPLKQTANPQKQPIASQRNPGWAISWQEPEIRIEGDTLQDLKSDTLTLNRMSVQSEMLDLSAKGEIRDFSTTRDVRLAGEVTYDWENLTPLLRSKLGPDVEIVGRETRPFNLTGPMGTAHAARLQAEVLNAQPRPLLPNTRPLFTPTDRYMDLKGNAGIGWEQANIRGLTSGKTTIEARIQDGQIHITPLDLQVSGGRLRLAPIVRLDVKPAALVFEKGAVIDNFQFTPEMTRNSLRFVAPMIANSTNIQGQFSLSQEFAVIPIDEPKLGEAKGTLMIKSARVKPGPLFDALSEKINQVLAVVNINRTGRLIDADSVFMQVDNQAVHYHMIEGRVYHSPFEVQMKGITVRTTGSVGLDESLDLVAEVGFTNMLSEDKDQPVLKSLISRPLKLPIGGTLKKPKVDMRQVGNYAKQMGVNALDAVLGSGFGEQLQGLFPERTPEEMERIQKEREERKKERDKRREQKRLERLKRKQGL